MPFERERIDSLEKFRKLAQGVVDPEQAQNPERARAGELNWGCEEGKWLALFGGVPDEQNFWMWRELIRSFQRDDDKEVCFGGEAWLNPLHFAHVSDTDPMKVAYVPDAEKGRRDIYVITTVGRFLTKYYSDKLSADRIRTWANKHREKWLEQQVQFAETEEDCERVYMSGPSSCMSKDPGEWGLKLHPARVYAGRDTKIAYLTRDGKITARAVVCGEGYVRLYGDALLGEKLEKMGYRLDASCLNGARLKYIEFKKNNKPTFLLPYIDGSAQAVNIGEDGFGKYLCVDEDGYYDASTTGGYAHVNDKAMFRCDGCEERADLPGNPVWGGGLVCDDCLNTYVSAIVSTDGVTTGLVHEAEVVVIHGRSYLRELDLEYMGFEQDDYGEWYRPDAAERAA